jgi:hypothetical protein
MCSNATFGLLNATWMADCTAAALSAMVRTIGIGIIAAIIIATSAAADDRLDGREFVVREIAERTERPFDLKRTATRARQLRLLHIAVLLRLQLGEQPFAGVDPKSRTLHYRVLSAAHSAIATLGGLFNPVARSVVSDLEDLGGHRIAGCSAGDHVEALKFLVLVQPPEDGPRIGHARVCADLLHRAAAGQLRAERFG